MLFAVKLLWMQISDTSKLTPRCFGPFKHQFMPSAVCRPLRATAQCVPCVCACWEWFCKFPSRQVQVHPSQGYSSCVSRCHTGKWSQCSSSLGVRGLRVLYFGWGIVKVPVCSSKQHSFGFTLQVNSDDMLCELEHASDLSRLNTCGLLLSCWSLLSLG